MIRVFVTLAFPLLFVVAEHQFRNDIGAPAWSFITPTLASAGIALLFGCVEPKNRTDQLSARNKKALPGMKLVSTADLTVTGVSWVCIVLFSFCWLELIHISIVQDDAGLAAMLWGCKALYFGVAIYAISAALAEAKELV